MTLKLDVNDIIIELREIGVIDSTSKITNKMDGTTPLL